MEKNKAPSQKLLQQLFQEEFLRTGRTTVPECEISFYPYSGLTNTIRARNGRILIRISDLLTEAPPEILRCVMAILLHKLLRYKLDEEVRRLYRRFVSRPEFRGKVHEIRRRRGRKHLSSPRGKVFDLQKLFNDLNETYFDNQLDVQHISWSQKANRTSLGHYDSAHDTIIVNKRLDHPRVPLHVVSYVLYHEMLHAFMGEEPAGKGHRIHHRRFREAERRFEKYSEAKAFIQERYHQLKRG